MMKEIAGWEIRAKQLLEEIKAKIPEAYKNLDVDYSEYEESPGVVWIVNMPERLQVPGGWAKSLESAQNLAFFLEELQWAIQQKLERKGVHIEIPPPATENGKESEPDAEKEPGQSVSVEG